jgi:CBS-domain-containing membrane protein
MYVKKKHTNKQSNNGLISFWRKTKQEKKIEIAYILFLKDLSRLNAIQSVRADDDVFKVASLLARKGVHRVAVINDKDEIVDIISQSTLINFFHKHVRMSGKTIHPIFLTILLFV